MGSQFKCSTVPCVASLITSAQQQLGRRGILHELPRESLPRLSMSEEVEEENEESVTEQHKRTSTRTHTHTHTHTPERCLSKLGPMERAPSNHLLLSNITNGADGTASTSGAVAMAACMAGSTRCSSSSSSTCCWL